MQIILLGTTGYHPNNNRHTACMMIPEKGIVLDAGTGFFRVREHLQTKHLNVYMSHAHLDHSMGLTFLFDVLWDKDCDDVRVFGEKEKLDTITNHLLDPMLFPVKPPFKSKPLPESPFESKTGEKVTYFPLVHPGGSVGYRFDFEDTSLAYVTDTTACPDAGYVESIAGVDLLLHECYFRDGYEERAELTGHSCITPVAKVAAKARVKKLVLLHVNPLDESDDPVGIETAKAIFPETYLGEDNMVIDF